MKLIHLHGGKAAMVSDEDYEHLCGFSWHLNANGYPLRHITLSVGKYSKIEMHNCIMDCPKGMEVDHRNGNKLDNTRENLRLATRAQNARNSKPKNGKRFKGVNKNGSGFSACVRQGPRGSVTSFYCGTFATEEAAARAYDRKAHELDPEFSRLNFADGIWSQETIDGLKLITPEPISGITGIQPNGRNWAAKVKRNGKMYHVGTFKTKEEAVTARESFLALLK